MSVRPHKRQKCAQPINQRKRSLPKKFLNANFSMLPDDRNELKNGHLLHLMLVNRSYAETWKTISDKYSCEISREMRMQLVVRSERVKRLSCISQNYQSVCCQSFVLPPAKLQPRDSPGSVSDQATSEQSELAAPNLPETMQRSIMIDHPYNLQREDKPSSLKVSNVGLSTTSEASEIAKSNQRTKQWSIMAAVGHPYDLQTEDTSSTITVSDEVAPFNIISDESDSDSSPLEAIQSSNMDDHPDNLQTKDKFIIVTGQDLLATTVSELEAPSPPQAMQWSIMADYYDNLQTEDTPSSIEDQDLATSEVSELEAPELEAPSPPQAMHWSIMADYYDDLQTEDTLSSIDRVQPIILGKRSLPREYLTEKFSILPDDPYDLKNGHMMLLHIKNDKNPVATWKAFRRKYSNEFPKKSILSKTMSLAYNVNSSSDAKPRFIGICSQPFMFHLTEIQPKESSEHISDQAVKSTSQASELVLFDAPRGMQSSDIVHHPDISTLDTGEQQSIIHGLKTSKRKYSWEKLKMALHLQYLTDNFGALPEDENNLKNGHILLLYKKHNNSKLAAKKLITEKYLCKFNEKSISTKISRLMNLVRKLFHEMTKFREICYRPFLLQPSKIQASTPYSKYRICTIKKIHPLETSWHREYLKESFSMMPEDKNEVKNGHVLHLHMTTEKSLLKTWEVVKEQSLSSFSYNKERFRSLCCQLFIFFPRESAEPEQDHQTNAEEPNISPIMQSSDIVDHSDNLQTENMSSSNEHSTRLAIQKQIYSHKQLVEMRKKVAKKLAKKLEKQKTSKCKKLEKTIGKCSKHLLDILTGNIVGRNICHVWYNTESKKQTVHFGMFMKILKKKADTYRIGYRLEAETYGGIVKHYDFTKYELAADLLSGDLIMMS